MAGVTGRLLTAAANARTADSLLDGVGGEDGLTRPLQRFYYHMDTRPSAAVVRAMHGDDLESMTLRLGRFLGGWLRGTGRERISIIPLAHMRFAIGPDERDAWLACMRAALSDVGVAPAVAEELMARLEPVADLCRTDEAAGDF